MYLYKQNARLGLTINDLRQENRNTSFPTNEFPEFPGYLRYKVTPQPVISKDERLVETEPILTPDGYMQLWGIETINNEELVQLIQQYKSKLKNEVKNKKKNIQVNIPISIEGISFALDSKTQTQISRAATTSKKDSAFQLDWTTLDGQTVVLPSDKIIKIATGIREHLQNLAKKEAKFISSIDSAALVSELETIESEISSWVK